MKLSTSIYSIYTDYHGINGNVSLDRRGELVTTPSNRYDLTLGSDKSSSLSRSEAGTYDIAQAETRTRNNENIANNNVSQGPTTNGNGPHHTIESTDGETKKIRKWPTEKSYFLAKELLMTERTYKKDLDILNQSLSDQITADDVENLQPLFHLLDSMIQHHNVFLRDLEHRLLLWEGRGTHESHRIGDVMLRSMAVLPVYEEYVENHREILERLNEMFESDTRFQQIYKEFEQEKICYLPITYLVLKPLHRLLHYQLILERLVDFYSDEHIDRADCQGVLHMLNRIADTVQNCLPESENYVLLCELQRDINGFDTLIQPNRRLIRQGCLLKHSKRGLQQRMFFLFSDILLYGTKSPVSQTFRILGHVPVRSLLTENAEHNTFVIFGGHSAITVSAGTTAEKTLWLAELAKASADIKNKPPTQITFGSLKNCSSSEEGLETCGLAPPPTQSLHQASNNLTNGTANTSSTNEASGMAAAVVATATTSKMPPSRSNTALHVCWHRGATVGLADHLVAAENELSGYLLRKFKNSAGWQKLWVVFTSFCLYFYKSYQDDYALASLPLLGYSVGPPGYQDAVQKEFVFKLSFKNHVYFFRAESDHTYNRWLEVLRSTTQTQDFKNMIT